MALEFALQAGGDAELGPLPEPVDFGGEVGGELGGVKHQQGFVVLMGRRGAPVEGTGDHGAVVDHRQLVVELVAAGQPRGANSLQGLLPGPVACLQAAAVVGQLDAQQIQHFAEGPVGEARVGQQADLDTALLQAGHGIGQALL